MSSTITQSRHTNFSALRLANQFISLNVIPALGGKIASLQHLPSRREWLWHNPRLSYSQPDFRSSYVLEYDLGGLDECFPAITPEPFPVEPWRGIPIADHGELWFQPWQVEQISEHPTRVQVTLVCYGLRFPYRFERTLTLADGRSGVDLTYRVTNLSSYPFPFVWSIHPLLAVEAGMRIELPAQVMQVRLGGTTDGRLGHAGTWLDWPVAVPTDGDMIDLAQVPSGAVRRATKLYTASLSSDSVQRAAITTADGEHSLAFRFSPQEITHIGLWLNYGGWAGDGGAPYFNLGFEPCIGGADSLVTSVEELEEHGVLAPHATQEWKLAIDLM